MNLNVNNLSEFKIKDLYRLTWNDDLKLSNELIDAVNAANDAIGKAYDIYYKEIALPLAEAKRKAEDERSKREDLRFQVTANEANLISSVLGQMSDGKWENTRSYEKYWRNISITADNIVVVNKHIKYAAWNNTWDNEYNEFFTTAEGVKKFFKKKARLVISDELKYNYGTTINKLKDCGDEPCTWLCNSLMSFADIIKLADQLA